MSNLYNLVSSPEIDYNEPINNRAKLDTGTNCNYSCGFCYYLGDLDKVTSFETIKERIDYLIQCEIKEVDLSGGESSIHQDWFKILDYCTANNLYISTLSNGSKFKDIDFLEKSKEHGLKEILFSLHGYNEESHNKLVNHPKGFQHIIEAIKNANKLDIKVRINCTVTHLNYKHLIEFAKLIKQFNIFEVNFLTLNYWNNASGIQTINYSEITPYIHKAIDFLNDFCLINVRYTPYCFMKGYEKYVCNTYQHIYDIYDWNIAVYDQKINPKQYIIDKHKALFDTAKQNRTHTYYKKPECFNCKHFKICDGIEKQLDIELYPEHGEKISNVNFYRKGFYERH